MTEAQLKLFNKWDVSEIVVEDKGLIPYLTIAPILAPRLSGREAFRRFGKTKYNILERLIGKLMVPGHRGKKHRVTSGHITGKGTHAYNILLKTLAIIEREMKQNPVKVLVKAIENAAPREEITTIEYGGARYPQSVECAPQRRIDITLRQFIQGSYDQCFDSKKKMEQALADEIIKAFRNDPTSKAVAKKMELERQAESSR